jgi:hypothetical protein
VLGLCGLRALAGCVPGALTAAGDDGGSKVKLDAAGSPHGDGGERDRHAPAEADRPEGGAADAPSSDAPPVDTSVADGAHDAPSDGRLPPILCEKELCPVPSEICCVTIPDAAGSVCKTDKSSCGELGFTHTRVECDQPADCPPGNSCCGTKGVVGNTYTRLECQPSCTAGADGGPGSDVVFCNPEATPDVCAPLGLMCRPSAILLGYFVCEGP